MMLEADPRTGFERFVTEGDREAHPQLDLVSTFLLVDLKFLFGFFGEVLVIGYDW